jgi:hypothetical protein
LSTLRAIDFKPLLDNQDLQLSITITAMADVATASGAAILNGADKKKADGKPEKPDEGVYNETLKKAEKAHADAMARLVSCLLHALLRQISL